MLGWPRFTIAKMGSPSMKWTRPSWRYGLQEGLLLLRFRASESASPEHGLLSPVVGTPLCCCPICGGRGAHARFAFFALPSARPHVIRESHIPVLRKSINFTFKSSIRFIEKLSKKYRVPIHPPTFVPNVHTIHSFLWHYYVQE